MASFREQLRVYAAGFFTNWRNPRYGALEKIGLTIRNRSLSVVRGGCCGNHGQPGC